MRCVQWEDGVCEMRCLGGGRCVQWEEGVWR